MPGGLAPEGTTQRFSPFCPMDCALRYCFPYRSRSRFDFPFQSCWMVNHSDCGLNSCCQFPPLWANQQLPFPLPKASRQSERNKSNWNRLEAAKPPWLFRFYHASHTPLRFANANTWLRRQRVRQGLVLRWLGGIAWTSKVGLIFDRVPRILVRERLSDGLIGSFVATPSLVRNWHALEALGIACFQRASPSPSL